MKPDDSLVPFFPFSFHVYSQFSYESGLSDNWSQVRLSASKATDNFLQSLDAESKKRFYPALLPCICLNRYYVAEGVKLYNQQTWKTIVERAEVRINEVWLRYLFSYLLPRSMTNSKEAAANIIRMWAMGRTATFPIFTEHLS